MGNKPIFLLRCLLLYGLTVALAGIFFVQAQIFSVSDYIQLAAFITLGALALLAEPFNRWWFGPELLIKFEKVKPYFFIGPQYFEEITTDGLYIRFKVLNVGKTPAMRCECSIEDIYEITSSGRKKIDNFQPVNIQWAGGKSTDAHVNISPSEVGIFCSFINISKKHPNYHSDHQFTRVHFDFVGGGTWPMHLMLEPKKKYQIRVDITANNAKQQSAFFEIKWSGNWPVNEENIWTELEMEQIGHESLSTKEEGEPQEMKPRQPFFKEIIQNLTSESEGWNGFLTRLLLAVFLGVITYFAFIGWYIWALALLFIFVALSGGFKARIEGVLTFATVIILLIQAIIQARDFDLKSKSFVDVQPLSFELKHAVEKIPGTLHMTVNLIGSGDLGAVVESLEYIPFVTHNGVFLDKKEAVKGINLSRLNKEFGVVHWSDLILFPTQPIRTQNITNNPFGEGDVNLLGGDNKDVFIWFKVKYRTVGSSESSWYWTIFKSTDMSGTAFAPIKSGFGNRDFAKEYNVR